MTETTNKTQVKVLYAYQTLVHGARVITPGEIVRGMAREDEQVLIEAGQAGYEWPKPEPRKAA